MFPKSIEVGRTEYFVHQEDDLHCYENGQYVRLDGQIRYREKVILIDNHQTYESSLETLLHEILHGISAETSLRLSEQKVTQLGYMLTEIFLNSPPLTEAFYLGAKARPQTKLAKAVRFLHHYNCSGMSNDKIGEILGCSRFTVARAKQALQE